MEAQISTDIIAYVTALLATFGFKSQYISITSSIIMLSLILLLSYIAFYISRYIIVSQISKIIKKSKTSYDDIILEKKVFHRLAYIAPALVIYSLIQHAIPNYDWIIKLLKDLSFIWIIIVILRTTNAFLNALHEIYQHLPISKNRPITGYLQLIIILTYFMGILSIISVVFNFEIGKIFAGLGAIAAVLILVFKDTILGLVASIQLSGNDMVKPGDWIEVPKYHADGTVLEITLNTVKVQNWDKTISTIPTYALVADSFQNWKGMEESGGRRIKRAIYIDMKSIQFLNTELETKLRNFHLLRDYLDTRKREIDAANAKLQLGEGEIYNGRRMTNIGTFRKYLEYYLRAHPQIHSDMTFLVRQLQPSPDGLPLEIYVFCKDQAWANYEAIQADIFDHIFAIIPEFNLKVFQNPTGDDFANLGRS